MQQLLGSHSIDASFLRELFLQKLPSNVCMVLASTPDSTSLEQLAEMTDKIMEAASLSISSLSQTPPSPAQGCDPPSTLVAEVESLRSEVSRLGKLLQ